MVSVRRERRSGPSRWCCRLTANFSAGGTRARFASTLEMSGAKMLDAVEPVSVPATRRVREPLVGPRAAAPLDSAQCRDLGDDARMERRRLRVAVHVLRVANGKNRGRPEGVRGANNAGITQPSGCGGKKPIDET